MAHTHLRFAVIIGTLALSGTAFAQYWDPTPPNARTIGNPPTFIDTPALGVPIEGRSAAQDDVYDYNTYRPTPHRPHPRVYIDPDY